MEGKILKKIGSIALSLLMTAGAGAAMSAAVIPQASLTAFAAETYGDYKYTILDDGTAEISKYNGSEASVNIPSAIDGKSVTSIGTEAFYSCQSLTSVIIPDSVTSIGNSAFEDCTSLNKVIYNGTEESFQQIEMPDGVRNQLTPLVKDETKPASSASESENKTSSADESGSTSQENKNSTGAKDSSDPESKTDNSSPQGNSDNNGVMIIVIIAAAVVCGIIVAVVLVKKNKNKKQQS